MATKISARVFIDQCHKRGPSDDTQCSLELVPSQTTNNNNNNDNNNNLRDYALPDSHQTIIKNPWEPISDRRDLTGCQHQLVQDLEQQQQQQQLMECDLDDQLNPLDPMDSDGGAGGVGGGGSLCAAESQVEQSFEFERLYYQRAQNYTQRRTSLHGKTITVRISRNETRYRKLQAKIYNFLERPKTWPSIVYHVFVFASVFGCLILSVLSTIQEYTESAGRILLYMELAILFWFFAEYCLRLWSAGCRSRYQTWRGRFHFARRPFCIVDIIVIVASVVVLAVDSDRNMFAASALRGLRFFQILRMIRMDRRGGSFKLLASVVWAHRQELFTTVYIGFLGLIFSSFLIYLVEKKENEKIKTYADALWWGVITLCTVGYGDSVPLSGLGKIIAGCSCLGIISFYALPPITLCTVGYGDTVPRTWIGKIIAAFCALAGISFFALPAGILGSGFALKVQQHQRQKHLIRRRVPAATLIQCLWRCYASDPNSTSIATWKIHMRPLRKPTGLTSSYSMIERGGFSRFSRFSTLKRRSDKSIPTGSTTVAASPTVTGQTNLPTRTNPEKASPGTASSTSIAPKSAPAGQETGHLLYAFGSPGETKRLQHIDESFDSEKIQTTDLMEKKDDVDVKIQNEDNQLENSQSSVNELLLMKLKRQFTVHSRNCTTPTKQSNTAREDNAMKYGRGAGVVMRQLTEKEKIAIRVIRKMRFFVAKRKFREALRPYDVKDVIEQYSAGHLDMLARVKILQSRLDQILGRQGAKSEDVYDSHQSLASRIVKIEHKIDTVELKLDRLVNLYKADRLFHIRPENMKPLPNKRFPNKSVSATQTADIEKIVCAYKSGSLNVAWVDNNNNNNNNNGNTQVELEASGLTQIHHPDPLLDTPSDSVSSQPLKGPSPPPKQQQSLLDEESRWKRLRTTPKSYLGVLSSRHSDTSTLLSIGSVLQNPDPGCLRTLNPFDKNRPQSSAVSTNSLKLLNVTVPYNPLNPLEDDREHFDQPQMTTTSEIQFPQAKVASENPLASLIMEKRANLRRQHSHSRSSLESMLQSSTTSISLHPLKEEPSITCPVAKDLDPFQAFLIPDSSREAESPEPMGLSQSTDLGFPDPLSKTDSSPSFKKES